MSTRPTPSALRALVPLALALAASACRILPDPPAPARYLVLVPAEELPDAPPAAPPAADAPALGLGPLTLPEYLRRAELVAREGTRLVPSPDERWAEPLERAVARVLGGDLARALGAAPPVAHPWYATERPDVQVEVTFARFERDGAGDVVVDAAWTVRRLESGAERAGRSVVAYPAASDGPATALALSRALAELALELADAVRSLSQ